MITLMLIAILLPPAPPDTLTLDEARELALRHNPASEQVGIQQNITELNLQNLNSGWYPDFSLRGSAQYQSDVTEVDIEAPVPGADIDIPSQPHDRYEIGLNLEQRIYDGGITGIRKEIERRNRETRLQEVEAEQHRLRERVESVYFSVLRLRAQQASLDLLREDIESRKAEIEVARREGAVPASAVDVLSAELIELRQKRLELDARHQSAINVLQELIEMPLDAQVEFVLPEPEAAGEELYFGERPEMALFQAQRDQLESRQRLTATSLRPSVSVFGQAAYSRPGLNLFEDEFQPWFIAGIRARWSIWDWGDQSRQQEVLALQQNMVDTREKEFLRNMRAASQEELAEIDRLQRAMELDEELIELRQRVLNEAESRLDHGAITTTEYLSKLNALHRAELSREQHRIELAQVYVKLNTRMGE